MNTGQLRGPVREWRWDRWCVRTGTTLEWAARNCYGKDKDDPVAHEAMQNLIIQEQKRAETIVAAETVSLLGTATKITGMTYHNKLTGQQLPCIKPRDVRDSWTQDGSDSNMKRLAWIFYYYGSELYQQNLSITHGEWVEQKLMHIFNFKYVHVEELAVNQRTCAICNFPRGKDVIEIKAIHSQSYLRFSQEI